VTGSSSGIPQTRKGQGNTHLSRAEFEARLREQFYDPAFAGIATAVDAVVETAWQAYDATRKSPRKRAAGPGFADPDFELPLEWLAARQAILEAQRRHEDTAAPGRVLLVCASPRSDETCPGEMSKTFRMSGIAAALLRELGISVDLRDLSLLTSESGRRIFPCKACVSTAMPLCHWPCSCYPNYALGQDNDWMNELYPRFTAAHGIMIITPVHWYQAPSVLKLLIDRLVCADGGNPDPTTTHGKKTQEAKALEMAGWCYPRHLRGRAFAVIVHGDSAGAETLRRSLCDWLADLELVPADSAALLDRYVGYYGKYAESHEAFDRDEAFQQEIGNAARALAAKITALRSGECSPLAGLIEPRPK